MVLRRFAWLIILLCLIRTAAANLSAEQLLLVSNSNSMESVELARYYARVRHVPEAQILSLDLPKVEDIVPDQYESRLATKVREYLASEAGRPIKCVVLFYGVPLHISSRSNTPDERQELTRLRNITNVLEARVRALADQADAEVRRTGQQPKTFEGSNLAISLRRFDSARWQLTNWEQKSSDEAMKKTIADNLQRVALEMNQASVNLLGTSPSTNSSSQPTTRIATEDLPRTYEEFNRLVQHHRDPDARDKVRRMVALRSGPIALAQTVEDQIEWLSEEQSDASVDSELSLVRENDYPRYLYRLNTYSLSYADSPPNQIMVARIDGPDLQIARRLIDDAIAVEKEGLSGQFVIDSRGLPNDKLGTYGWYDEFLRNTAKITQSKTNISITLDEKPEVLPAGAQSNVGLYIGWYNLQKYVPACKLNRGAVAFHVASLELTDLHTPATREWVANLLRDGAAATLGAVSEPYLHAFPQPNQFFPMLMTGKWSLAEVYWMTTPFASWKISMIGDPLYKPFAAKPALKPEDLPPGMVESIGKIEEKYGLNR